MILTVTICILFILVILSFVLGVLLVDIKDRVVNINIYKNKKLIKALYILSNFSISFTTTFIYINIFANKFNISKYIFYLYIITIILLAIVSFIISLIRQYKFIDTLNKVILNLIGYISILFFVALFIFVIIHVNNYSYNIILNIQLTQEIEYLQSIILNEFSIAISICIFIVYKSTVKKPKF